MIYEQSAEQIAVFCRTYFKSKKDLPIRSSEMGVLIFIVQSNQAITPVMISQAFNISKPSVTQMVKQLQSQGFLVSEPAPQDKRSVLLRATVEGDRLVQEAGEAYFALIEHLHQTMGETKFNTFMSLIQEATSIMKGDTL